MDYTNYKTIVTSQLLTCKCDKNFKNGQKTFLRLCFYKQCFEHRVMRYTINTQQ